MTHIYLVRHGEAQYDLAEKRRLRGGMRDMVPLTDRGREQAQTAAIELAGYGVGKIIVSPMTRAMETAHIISSALQAPLTVEFDLHEWLPDLQCTYDNTAFVGLQAEEMHNHAGEWPAGEVRSWEPLSQVRQRVMVVLQKYGGVLPIAVVAHGMVIYALTGQRIDNCQIVQYQLEDTE